MGYPTSQQKVDYLFKKIGFTKTKTGIAEDQTGFTGNEKAPPNEAIPSPLVLPASSIWSDSEYISETPPEVNGAYVGVHTVGNAFRMTVDSTVSNNRTFIARETWGNPSSAIKGDWIDTQFGDDYLIKVHLGDPSTVSPGAAYTYLSAAGTLAGPNDTWFFDYSSGVLNFNGADLDGQLSGITTSNIYLVGYRYIGRKGIQPAAGIGTFHNLHVAGLSTFVGDAQFNSNVSIAGTLTYEDVTNVDSVGMITARKGIQVLADGIDVQTGITTTFTLNVGTAGQTLVGITTILDEDTMSSNSATALVTQQSIKAYVDSTVTAQDLDFFADSGGALNIDLDSEELEIAGTVNEITTVGSGNSITFGLPDNVIVGNDLTVTGDIASVTNLNVTGVSTFTGISTFSSTLLTQKSVQIEENLNVSGLSTFVGDAKFQADVYSDQIRRYSDSGTTTKINLQDEDIRLFAGHSTQYVLGVTPTQVTIANSGHLNVTGVSTFAGISTFSSTLLTQKSVQIEENLNVSGVGTFASISVSGIDENKVIFGSTNGGLQDSANLTFNGTLFNVGQSTGISSILDEDNMTSDRADALATQQSIKAYVDTQVTAQDLDFFADSGGALNIDLDSEELEIAGTTNEITTVGAGNSVTIGLPDDVTIGDDLTVTGDIASVTNVNVTGVSTFTGDIDANADIELAGNIAVTGVSTFIGETNIGTGGTVFTALVGAAASVGIGSTLPAYMLDVTGAINSSNDIKINGTSVLTSSLNEAVAMAIALG